MSWLALHSDLAVAVADAPDMVDEGATVDGWRVSASYRLIGESLCPCLVSQEFWQCCMARCRGDGGRLHC